MKQPYYKLAGKMRVSWKVGRMFKGRYINIHTKRGVYYGLVCHHQSYKGPQMAIVKFEGNKNTSRIPLSDIQRIKI